MTTSDTRAVSEFRIAATDLKAGDLINTSPGGDDDWQQVLSVHTKDNPGSDADAAKLIAEIGDRYVLVRMTDVAPVDSPVYFVDGVAQVFGEDSEDVPASTVISDSFGERSFLYTRFELVTVRA